MTVFVFALVCVCGFLAHEIGSIFCVTSADSLEHIRKPNQKALDLGGGGDKTFLRSAETPYLNKDPDI